jgi:hypothetical protein
VIVETSSPSCACAGRPGSRIRRSLPTWDWIMVLADGSLTTASNPVSPARPAKWRAAYHFTTTIPTGDDTHQYRFRIPGAR